MSSLSMELVLLILQFLDEEKFKETVHTLEQESGFFFNMKYFEDQVRGGKWEEAERYLSGFTKVDDNHYSVKMFFEIRKQKYLEALDKQDRAKAVDILVKDLKVFSSFNEELYKEITQLLTLDNFRENEQLSKYGDTKSARNIILIELKKLIEANPLFREKLTFPALKASRLRTLINQSLNWQHQLSKNRRPNPDIKTLFSDHTCGPPNGDRAPSPTNNPLVGALSKTGAFPPLYHSLSYNRGLLEPAVSEAPGVNPMTVVSAAGGPPPGGPDRPDRNARSVFMASPVMDGPSLIVGQTRPLDRNVNDHNGIDNNLPQQEQKPRVQEDLGDRGTSWNLTEIADPSQCRSIRLPDTLPASKISRLIYTNSGIPLLALCSSAVHNLWKWTRPRDRNVNDHNGIDNNRPQQEQKPRVQEDLGDRGKSWKLTEIADPSQCRSTRLLDTLPASKISRLIYTNSGIALLALCSNTVHKLWKWTRNDGNPTGKATAICPPILWQPPSGILMTNDVDNTNSNPEDAVSCIALSKNDSYVISASGGKVSLFNMMTFKVMTTLMPPPPAATFLAFHPQDNNIIAIGMEDSTIQIYNASFGEVKSKLKGHQKKITGLAFSSALNVLVSSGADAQLTVWSTDQWEKRKSNFLQTQTGRAQPPPMGDTRVQFHNDQIRLLVVHESQLAIYDAAKLERMRHWVPRDAFSASISSATYSCDSLLVYAGFVDGCIGVFDADSLRPRCRLSATVHIPSGVNGATAFSFVIAAHPSEPNQFALGLSDGGVQVIEPLVSDGKWGTGPPSDNEGQTTVSDQASGITQGAEPGPR